MRPWLVAAMWIAWLLLAGGPGVFRSKPGDRVLDHGTRAWADAITVVLLVGAILAAVFIQGAAIPIDPWLAFSLGSVVVVLGVALRLWAARTLGRFFTQSVTISPGQFVVTSGPYRFVRHPGYTGLLVSLVGLALMLGNWASILIVIAGFFVAHVPRIRVEERALEENLGEEYRAFEHTHKRLVPGVW